MPEPQHPLGQASGSGESRDPWACRQCPSVFQQALERGAEGADERPLLQQLRERQRAQSALTDALEKQVRERRRRDAHEQIEEEKKTLEHFENYGGRLGPEADPAQLSLQRIIERRRSELVERESRLAHRPAAAPAQVFPARPGRDRAGSASPPPQRAALFPAQQERARAPPAWEPPKPEEGRGPSLREERLRLREAERRRRQEQQQQQQQQQEAEEAPEEEPPPQRSPEPPEGGEQGELEGTREGSMDANGRSRRDEVWEAKRRQRLERMQGRGGGDDPTPEPGRAGRGGRGGAFPFDARESTLDRKSRLQREMKDFYAPVIAAQASVPSPAILRRSARTSPAPEPRAAPDAYGARGGGAPEPAYGGGRAGRAPEPAREPADRRGGRDGYDRRASDAYDRRAPAPDPYEARRPAPDPYDRRAPPPDPYDRRGGRGGGYEDEGPAYGRRARQGGGGGGLEAPRPSTREVRRSQEAERKREYGRELEEQVRQREDARNRARAADRGDAGRA
eukprot:tig00022075_g23601.t1